MKLYAAQFAGRHFNTADRMVYVTESILLSSSMLVNHCHSLTQAHKITKSRNMASFL